MARYLQTAVLACSIVSFGTFAAVQNPDQEERASSSWPLTAIAGNWHFVDEVNLPNHTVDMRFELTEQGLRAVMLSHQTGGVILVMAEASFDGQVLRYRQQTEGTPFETVQMVMNVAGSALVGRWHQGGEPIGPTRKLVRGPHN